MFTSFAGLSVLVTGGSKGIGKGIATAFARAGARVVISGRDEDTLRRAADEIGGATGFVVADVSVPAQCRALAAEVVATHGGIDVLCANAGIFPSARLEELSEENLDKVMKTNLGGTVFVLQACVDALAASGRGRVIITSSITGPITGYPGWSHYGASKAAQLGFMRTAAIELASRGITVNAVLPGNIATEGLDGMGEDYLASMAATVPMKRLGSVADVGNAALYFATVEAGYVTGQCLTIDGGQVLPESLDAIG